MLCSTCELWRDPLCSSLPKTRQLNVSFSNCYWKCCNCTNDYVDHYAKGCLYCFSACLWNVSNLIITAKRHKSLHKVEIHDKQQQKCTDQKVLFPCQCQWWTSTMLYMLRFSVCRSSRWSLALHKQLVAWHWATLFHFQAFTCFVLFYNKKMVVVVVLVLLMLTEAVVSPFSRLLSESKHSCLSIGSPNSAHN